MQNHPALKSKSRILKPKLNAQPRKTPSPEGSRAAKLFAEQPGPETLRREFSLESVTAVASTMYLKESPYARS